MYVITADQVGSRSSTDLVTATLDQLNDGTLALARPAERTVGDELQLVLESPRDTLDVILRLTRAGTWSVGCGVGEVRSPLPASIREATGAAFVSARAAIDRAKKSPTRFALESSDAPERAADVEALIDLVLAIRARRSPEGWQIHDLLGEGMTQVEAARRLGISPQAVNDRVQAGHLHVVRAAHDPLVRLLAGLDSVDPANEGARP